MRWVVVSKWSVATFLARSFRNPMAMLCKWSNAVGLSVEDIRVYFVFCLVLIGAHLEALIAKEFPSPGMSIVLSWLWTMSSDKILRICNGSIMHAENQVRSNQFCMQMCDYIKCDVFWAPNLWSARGFSECGLAISDMPKQYPVLSYSQPHWWRQSSTDIHYKLVKYKSEMWQRIFDLCILFVYARCMHQKRNDA